MDDCFKDELLLLSIKARTAKEPAPSGRRRSLPARFHQSFRNATQSSRSSNKSAVPLRRHNSSVAVTGRHMPTEMEPSLQEQLVPEQAAAPAEVPEDQAAEMATCGAKKECNRRSCSHRYPGSRRAQEEAFLKFLNKHHSSTLLNEHEHSEETTEKNKNRHISRRLVAASNKSRRHSCCGVPCAA